MKEKALTAMLAVPTRGDIWHETMAMIAHLEPMIYLDRLSVASNRNKIARDFVNGRYEGRDIGKRDLLFMIDDDIIPPHREWAGVMAEAPFDVVAAPCPMAKMPDLPVILNVFNEPPGGGLVTVTFDDQDEYVECDAVGTGLVMIRRHVLEHPEMKAPFLQELDADGTIHVGQDIQFCRRAKKLGFTVGTVANLLCDHFKRLHLNTIPWVYGEAAGHVKNRVS